MTINTILLISDEHNSHIHEAILSKSGFQILKAEDCAVGLHLILEGKPDLVLMDQATFCEEGKTLLQDLQRQRAPIRTVISPVALDLLSVVQEFIEAGVYDYLTIPVDVDTLVDTVKQALEPCEDTYGVPMPIVAKLMTKVRQQAEAYRKLWDRYQWYKENIGHPACDCKELTGRGERAEPKSTALRKLGRVTDGYYDGDAYHCEVCKTCWVVWESHTHSQFLRTWQVEDQATLEFIHRA